MSAVPAGYKQTEVGVIPQDWAVTTLGELFEITSSKRVFQSEWTTQGVPFYRARELAVLGETGAVNNDLFITREMYERFKREYGVPAAGDMLVTGVGTLGKTYLVSSDHEFYFKDGNIIWFKIGESISSEFLKQLYLTPLVIKQIEDGSAGTTVGTYTITGANKTRISFPPIPEQRAIAAALSDVDALLAKLDQLIAKKRDLKQAAMQQLLTGQTRLPGFGGAWEVVKAGDIGRFRGGSGFPLKFQGATAGEYPFFKVSDMNNAGNETFMETANNYISEALRKQLGATAFPAESIVFAKVGAAVFLERKKILRKASCLDNNMAAFVMDASRAYCSFVHYVLLNTKLGSLVSTTALPSLSGSVLASIELPLPSLPEQTAIATVLADMDADLAALEARRDKTRALKQGMMQELLTGRIRLV